MRRLFPRLRATNRGPSMRVLLLSLSLLATGFGLAIESAAPVAASTCKPGYKSEEVHTNNGDGTASVTWKCVPIEYNRSVTIYAWQCPTAVDVASQVFATFSQTCLTPLDGISYFWEDTPPDYAAPSYLQWGVTKGGFVQLSGLPNDMIWISQIVPNGYETPVVFCQDPTWPTWVRYEVKTYAKAATIWHSLAKIPSLTCHWFNVPIPFNPTVSMSDQPAPEVTDPPGDIPVQAPPPTETEAGLPQPDPDPAAHTAGGVASPGRIVPVVEGCPAPGPGRISPTEGCDDVASRG